MYRLPTYYLSHGGGPWPWLLDQMPGVFDALNRFLTALPDQWPEKPRAVLVVSGHWEEDGFTVMSGAHPPMVYDYSGFPAFTYAIQYKAPGSPVVAERIGALLSASGLQSGTDAVRGFDHGTFSILYPMYPDADVPVLQLSMKRGYDPEEHLKLGRALAPLRDEGVVIIGSGSSYHNLRRFTNAPAESSAFDGWLQNALTAQKDETRNTALRTWLDAPYARFAHPQEDHLIPLMVAVGAAEHEKGIRIYNEMFMGGAMISSFRFGDTPADAHNATAATPTT